MYKYIVYKYIAIWTYTQTITLKTILTKQSNNSGNSAAAVNRVRFNEEVVWRSVEFSIIEIMKRYDGFKNCFADSNDLNGANDLNGSFEINPLIFVTGLSLGGECGMDMASLPGVGRCLSGRETFVAIFPGVGRCLAGMQGVFTFFTYHNSIN